VRQHLIGGCCEHDFLRFVRSANVRTIVAEMPSLSEALGSFQTAAPQPENCCELCGSDSSVRQGRFQYRPAHRASIVWADGRSKRLGRRLGTADRLRSRLSLLLQHMGKVLILLLCGGDKSMQATDIRNAKELARDFQQFAESRWSMSPGAPWRTDFECLRGLSARCRGWESWWRQSPGSGGEELGRLDEVAGDWRRCVPYLAGRTSR